MHDYETEEQQIEALKKWLKENLTSIIFGVSAGMLALGGWNYYIKHKNQHAIEASTLYMQVLQAVARPQEKDQEKDRAGPGEKAVDLGNRLVNDYADTPYAGLSAMLLAVKDAQAGNHDDAVSQFEWVRQHGSSEELRQLASLRLARLHIAAKAWDKALAILENSQHPVAFDALYAELKGDAYAGQGKLDEARAAYDHAINLSSGGSQWLRIKRDNLGATTTGAAAS